MEDKQKLNDIGGWLLFFIITLVIISPLFNLYILYTQLDVLVFTEIIEMLAIISLFILTGIFLWTKKPYAVKFAKVFLITTFILNIVLIFLLSDFSYIVQSTVYFIIWTPYLYKSERVKQVYGHLKEKQKGMQIWSILGIIYAFLAPIQGAVFSIITLFNISKNRKLRGLTLSIIALIVSMVYILILFGYGVLMSANFDYVPENIETLCSNYCYDAGITTWYFIEYSTKEGGYICYCTDEDSNVLDQTFYPHSIS